MLQAGASRHGMRFHQNTTISLVLGLWSEKLAHLKTASARGFHTPKSKSQRGMVPEEASGNAASWCKETWHEFSSEHHHLTGFGLVK